MKIATKKLSRLVRAMDWVRFVALYIIVGDAPSPTLWRLQEKLMPTNTAAKKSP